MAPRTQVSNSDSELIVSSSPRRFPHALGAADIPGPVGDARSQITLQRAGQPKLPRLADKADEHILHDIFRGGGVVRQRHRQPEQIVSVFLIDPAECCAVSLPQSPDEEPVFPHGSCPVVLRIDPFALI